MTVLTDEEHLDILGKEDNKNEAREEHKRDLESDLVTPAVLGPRRDEDATVGMSDLFD
jgi:hypothetical protein